MVAPGARGDHGLMTVRRAVTSGQAVVLATALPLAVLATTHPATAGETVFAGPRSDGRAA